MSNWPALGALFFTPSQYEEGVKEVSPFNHHGERGAHLDTRFGLFFPCFGTSMCMTLAGISPGAAAAPNHPQGPSIGKQWRLRPSCPLSLKRLRSRDLDELAFLSSPVQNAYFQGFVLVLKEMEGSGISCIWPSTQTWDTISSTWNRITST